MIVLVLIGALAAAGAIATVHTVVRDGYRRIPVKRA